MKLKINIYLGLFIFHSLVSIVMSIIAQSSFLDGYHNGLGLWNFAMDSFAYHESAIRSFEMLRESGYSAWWDAQSFRHSKFIGLMYYLIYPSPLSFAPVNAIAWSASVILVYLMARIVCENNQKLSIIIALTFGLWPSNLLMGTQLLRDPFFNLGILMMLLGWIAMLNGHRTIIYSLLVAMGMIIGAQVRPEPFWILNLVSLFAVIMVALQDRRTLPYAMLPLLVIAMFYNLPAITAHGAENEESKINKSAIIAVENDDQRIVAVKEKIRAQLGEAYTVQLDERISKWFEVTWFSPWKDFETKDKRLHALLEEHGSNLDAFLAKWMTPWEYSSWLPNRVESNVVKANEYRSGFLVWYLEPGTSLIDSDVQFRSINDIVAYIPRATMIGFFAPFPNQWFSTGKTAGKAIRVLGGIEMIAIYLLMIGFLIFLVKSTAPLRLKIWFVLFTIMLVIPLGLFVPNLGTLFRMRFIYILPILIGGVEGIKILLKNNKNFLPNLVKNV